MAIGSHDVQENFTTGCAVRGGCKSDGNFQNETPSTAQAHTVQHI